MSIFYNALVFAKRTHVSTVRCFRSVFALCARQSRTAIAWSYVICFLFAYARDSRTTDSTVLSLSQQSSCVSLSPKYTGKRNFMCFRNLPSGCSCSVSYTHLDVYKRQLRRGSLPKYRQRSATWMPTALNGAMQPYF